MRNTTHERLIASSGALSLFTIISVRVVTLKTWNLVYESGWKIHVKGM